jgi:tetratricopeptide (TPR) repeat protein
MTPTLFQKSVFTFLLILITNLCFAQSENYKIAYNFYKDGDSEKALEYFEKDIAENPKSAYSYFYLAVLYIIQEKLEVAENNIDKALLYFE